MAIDAGVRLEDLCIEEFQQCSKLIGEDIYALITPAACAAERKTLGGTAPERVKEQAAALKKIVSKRKKK